MPGDGRIPLRLAEGEAPPAPGELVVHAGGSRIAAMAALLRHAGSAAAAQAGACPCCRRPSDLATMLRRLVIERARGEVEFAGVLIAADQAEHAAIRAELARDPLIEARYRLPAE
jgi:hypothetical protein